MENMGSLKSLFPSMAFGKTAGRYVSLLVVFCFLLNGFAARFAAPDMDRDMLADIFAAQSSVIGLCCLSTLPLKMVYGLMGINSPTGSAAAPASPKDKQKTDNRSNDCTIAAPAPRFVPLKAHVFNPLGISHSYSFSYGQPSAVNIPRSSFPPGVWQILLMLAILCHILARSGIPAAVVSMTRYNHARSPKLSGFFFFKSVLCPNGVQTVS